MTTLLMLFACMRDLATDADAKKDCQDSIYQKGSHYKKSLSVIGSSFRLGIPYRVR